MSGTVEFTESSLRFVDISVDRRGRSCPRPPPSSRSRTTPKCVSVKSLRTPIDPFLLDSMPVEDRRVLETLSREDYDRLVANNLVISSGSTRSSSDVDDLRACSATR